MLQRKPRELVQPQLPLEEGVTQHWCVVRWAVSMHKVVCHLRGSGYNFKTPTNKTNRNTKRGTQSDTVRETQNKDNQGPPPYIFIHLNRPGESTKVSRGYQTQDLRSHLTDLPSCVLTRCPPTDQSYPPRSTQT